MEASLTSCHFRDNVTTPFLKGAIYYLSPFNIPLTIFITLQNCIVLKSYWSDRRRFVAGMFMAIAGADILMAHGQLVVSVCSILVYGGGLEEAVLYRSLYYFEAVGSLGYTYSRLFNLILAVTKTINIWVPFYRINKRAVRAATATMAVLCAVLHVSDTALAAVTAAKYEAEIPSYYASYLAYFVTMPGSVTVIRGKCLIKLSLCRSDISNIEAATILTLNFFLPSVIVLVCMVVQIRYLYQTLSEASNPLLSTARHISITVFLISTLYFVTNSAFAGFLVVTQVLGFGPDRVRSCVLQGTMTGVAELTLPLLNATSTLLISEECFVRAERMTRDRYTRVHSKVVGTMWQYES